MSRQKRHGEMLSKAVRGNLLKFAESLQGNKKGNCPMETSSLVL